MALLTEAERKMFAKWWGVEDLQGNGEFWQECLENYEDCDITVPILHNPSSARRIIENFECQRCAKCCHYPKVVITMTDIDRISRNTKHSSDELCSMYKSQALVGNEMFIDCSKGCPFLKGNRCTIYKYRPSSCYFFPISGSMESTNLAGSKNTLMNIRIKCYSSLVAIRGLMVEACKNNPVLLLPDLSLVVKNV